MIVYAKTCHIYVFTAVSTPGMEEPRKKPKGELLREISSKQRT